MFNREQSSGMYRPISFFVGRTVSEMPAQLFFVWIMATIAYWMCGLQYDAEKYLIFIAIMESLVVAISGLLLLFSALGKDISQAGSISNLGVLTLTLFDGNWVSLDKVPVYFRWIQHISCLGYAY